MTFIGAEVEFRTWPRCFAQERAVAPLLSRWSSLWESRLRVGQKLNPEKPMDSVASGMGLDVRRQQTRYTTGWMW
jgi:hypothetical protein